MALRLGILIIIALLTPLLAAAANSNGKDMLLDGNEIDLLVGAPTGIVEPLDTRRTRVAPENRYDYSELLDDDFQAETSFEDLGWTDAEEQPASEESTEAQYLDLVSEADEIEIEENAEGIAKTDAISSDSVETNSQL